MDPMNGATMKNIKANVFSTDPPSNFRAVSPGAGFNAAMQTKKAVR